MTKSRLQAGFSLVELMIAITIGLLLLAGLSGIFISSSDSNRELQRSAQQLENGRYAIQVMSQGLQHAGYYGQFSNALTVPAALPDPCTIPTLLTAVTYLNDSAPFTIQGYDSPPTPPALISGCLSAANHVPGTDILVIRRANTTALAVGGTAMNNEVYIQANSTEAAVQLGAGAAITNATQANGVTAATIKKRDNTAGEIRKYHVHIYFIAPCSTGSGALIPAGVGPERACQAGDAFLPTLKRLELRVPDGGGALAMQLVSLAEGIENFQVEYGIDDSPAVVNPDTNQIGDGVANCYKTNPAGGGIDGLGCTAGAAVGSWVNVVAVKINLLARNTEATRGYTDAKQYNLGLGNNAVAPGGEFKRHAYTSLVRLVNISGRREYQ